MHVKKRKLSKKHFFYFIETTLLYEVEHNINHDIPLNFPMFACKKQIDDAREVCST